MAIRKFNVEVTTTKEYQIELDDEIINEEWLAHFRSYMYDLESIEEVAENLAKYQARNGDDDFIEGYGYVTRDGELPLSLEDFKNGEWLPIEQRRQPAKGININLIDDDGYVEVQIIEIKKEVK